MRILLALSALIYFQTSFAKTLVIADIDDTLRLTHRKSSVWEQLQNVSDPSMAFYGMREVLDAFANQQAVIYYVSGTVAPISDFGWDFLSANNFPQKDNYIYRGWFEHTKEFKIRMVEELILQEKPDKIILLGDNGEKDSAAFGEIVKNHSNAVSFIHKLYGADGVPVPSSQSLFLTGADLALQLYLRGDLNAVGAHIAITAVEKALEIQDPFYRNFIFPEWGSLTTMDVERAFSAKNQWPEEAAALTAIETFVAKDARISLRYFHLCQ